MPYYHSISQDFEDSDKIAKIDKINKNKNNLETIN